MGRQFHLNVQPPHGGVVKSTAYQTQPPYTSFDSVNFWPLDARTDRAGVLSTRPGLSPLSRPSSTLSCQMLIPINGADSGKPYQSFVASFDSDVYWWNGTSFTAATGSQASAVSTGRAVYGAPFLQQVFICNNTTRPLMFDYDAGTVELMTESVGTAPTDVRMAASWQGALWLAGQLATPHILYGSRVGNAADWDSSVADTDRGGAFATTGENEGKLTGPITALMPQTFDTMIVSTFSGLIAMRAHPRQGGVFQPIGETTYAMGQGAWCKVPGDTIFMLTPLGMSMLEPHANATPVQISREKIPNELVGLAYNYENPVVSMAYSRRWNGIYIFIRGEEEQAWFYWIPNGSFHRMTFSAGYPFVAMEFPPFATHNTCDVLLGGYNSLNFFDAFSTEEFESSVVIGPVKLSDSTLTKSIIHQARVVSGRDTPDTGETSMLKIAVGNDGQDAIARLLQGLHQYEGSLVTASNNNGIVFPKVGGHAAAFGVEQFTGDLVIEGIDLLCESAGVNRLNRAPQIAVEDAAADFSDGNDDFDEDLWQGHSCATPAAPNSTQTDWTHWIDLSRLPQGWWDVVASDGRDIRATDEDGTQIPLDLIYFDSSAETGFCTVKMTQTIPPREVCLWVGNPDAGFHAVDHEFGQYAAYDDNWKQFLPSGGARDDGEEDRTQYENHITLVNQVSSADLSTGPIGVEATDYTNQDATNNYGRATASVPSTYPATLIVVVSDPDTTSLPCYGLRDQSGPTTANLEVTANRDATNQRCDAGSTDTAAGAAEDQSATLANSTDFRHFAAVISGAASRQAYLEGGNTTAVETTSITIASGVLDEIIIGKGARSGLSASSTTAELCLAQVHDVARSADWINYQWQMLDQDAFWGDWDDFVEVNPPPDETDPDSGACPLGIVDVTETGSWSGYAHATPQANPAITLVDWTHFIDLADMPVEWWTAVSASGVDIRATDMDNTFIPLDLIEFSKAGSTGFCVVKLTQNESQTHQIKLWVGNGSAVAVDECAAYGQYKAYDDDWLAFYPSGAGNDRTQYLHHLTSSGGVSEGDTTGPIGNTATNYDGDQRSFTAQESTFLNPAHVSLVSVARVNAPHLFSANAHIGVFDSNSLGMVSVGHTANATPGRLYVRPNYGTTWSASQNIAQSVGSWHHLMGFNSGTTLRQLWVDGAGDANTSGVSLPITGVDQIVVANTRVGNWPFVGDLTLLQVHNSIRSLTSGWAAYQESMLDQATFWGSWTWVAEVSSLPQP